MFSLPSLTHFEIVVCLSPLQQNNGVIILGFEVSLYKSTSQFTHDAYKFILLNACKYTILLRGFRVSRHVVSTKCPRKVSQNSIWHQQLGNRKRNCYYSKANTLHDGLKRTKYVLDHVQLRCNFGR